MLQINQVMRGITSTNSESQHSKMFEKEVLETSLCDCGQEYDSKYKMNVPFKEEPVLYENDKCFECQRKQEEEDLVKNIVAKNQEAKKHKIQKLFNNESLMNPRLQEASFENYQPTNAELSKAKKITKRYADNFSKDNPVSLLLMGNYGTGKSHLSVSITKTLMEKQFSCIFISTPKFLTKLRSTYNKNSDVTEEQLIESLISVDCLVLDDIGSEQTKQSDDMNQTWATSKLFEVIDSRIGKHTIFTTNFEPKELQQRLGGRNFSRMMENVHVIKMFGDDFRLRDFK